MRRDLLLAPALFGLIGAVVLGAAWALLAAPPVPRDLLPPDLLLAEVRPQGGGRQLVTARLGPRQGLQDLYEHLTARGWRLRRVNVVPEDEEQVYFRRSLGGYLLEVAIVARAGPGSGAVTVAYGRCLRRVTCAWR